MAGAPTFFSRPDFQGVKTPPLFEGDDPVTVLQQTRFSGGQNPEQLRCSCGSPLFLSRPDFQGVKTAGQVEQPPKLILFFSRPDFQGVKTAPPRHERLPQVLQQTRFSGGQNVSLVNGSRGEPFFSRPDFQGVKTCPCIREPPSVLQQTRFSGGQNAVSVVAPTPAPVFFSSPDFQGVKTGRRP